MQMRMFLTRLGEGSRMVITGDPSQTDLPGGQRSGLADAVDTLNDVEGVRFIRLTSKDVVRHDLVTRIVEAYDARDKEDQGGLAGTTASVVAARRRRGAGCCPVSSVWCARPRAPPPASAQALARPSRWPTTDACAR